MHQFRFAQLANKALSNTYFAILALLELCKIICFPSLCSGTKYISTARSARCANKVSFGSTFTGWRTLFTCSLLLPDGSRNIYCNFLFRFHPPMFIFHTLDCNYNLILCHTEFKSRDIHRIISWKNLIVLLRCDISNFLWTRVRSDNMMIT